MSMGPRQLWACWRQERQLHEDLLFLCVLALLALVVPTVQEWPALRIWLSPLPEFLDRSVRVLEGLFYFASVIAVVFAIIPFFLRRGEQSRRDEYEKYVESNNRYLDFVKLLTAYPLIVADEPGVNLPELSTADEYRQRQIVDYFWCLAEEMYLLQQYIPRPQWQAWEGYIRIHCQISEFRDYWYENGVLKESVTLDPGFERYVREILR